MTIVNDTYKTITLPSIKLRPYQSKPFRDLFIHGKKRIIRILHRRAGKDREAINLVHMAALMRPGLYLYLLPKINQARTVIWEGRGSDGRKFIDCIPNALIKKDHQTTMTRYLSNGSIIKVAGADNYEALIGSNPLGIVFSEYALCHPNAWNYLRPILAENNGFAIFPYTPRGLNHGWDLYNENLNNPAWSVTKLSANDTKHADGSPIITPDIIESDRRAGMPEPLIQQEYFCDFTSAILGAYFPDEMGAVLKEGRICEFPVEKNVDVHTSWDLGVDDKNVIILWQKIGSQFRAIYHIENSRKGLKWYLDELARVKQLLGFNRWGQHFGPHDIQVMEWGAGKTRYAQALELGFRFTTVPKVLDVEGIQCVRYIFNRFVFHVQHTKILVNALTQYKSDFDFDKKVFGSRPVHDWTSHHFKAVQYFAVGYMFSYDQHNYNQQRVYARQMAT